MLAPHRLISPRAGDPHASPPQGDAASCRIDLRNERDRGVFARHPASASAAPALGAAEPARHRHESVGCPHQGRGLVAAAPARPKLAQTKASPAAVRRRGPCTHAPEAKALGFTDQPRAPSRSSRSAALFLRGPEPPRQPWQSSRSCDPKRRRGTESSGAVLLFKMDVALLVARCWSLVKPLTGTSLA